MPSSTDALTAALDTVLEASPTEAAQALGRAMKAASRDPRQGAGLDDRILSGLGNHRKPDALLELLDLQDLAALAERLCERLESDGPLPPREQRAPAWNLLDVLRRSAALRRIPREEIESWTGRFLRLVERSHYTAGPLFRRRVAAYGSKTLFQVHEKGNVRSLNWRQAAAQVEAIARGLIALHPDRRPGPVGILSENRPEMALADLACLTSGLLNVMIPANSTPESILFMLNHSQVETLVVSTHRQLAKVAFQRPSCPALKWIVILEPVRDLPRDVLTLDQVCARAHKTPAALLLERSEAVRIDDLATTMYTSGTTGQPKGIQFTHRNIVFKRFARALALPEIGENDIFVCYLPLFHTFGRFLEMFGSVFWGATYNFVLNPSVEALIRAMRRSLPTVFISVPKKWIQLYDAITASLDPIRADESEYQEAIRKVTGGRLRWGLSAAGHLPSELFRFFQANGIELMSGFGMTEATGGITMTPPGEYKDDSLGTALPGVEIRLAEDGELLIRGPYVMAGYLDPPEDEATFDEEGWFPTGDLMEMDQDGHIRLVDRKKEIYKNIKGETIAPQRVENPFRDFESVGRVFLVGDHREYNTALIYPDPSYRAANLEGLSAEEIKTHFRSVVVSVNRFLAPFERIVDFSIIDRDLDPEKGELTPKGTPRRRTVENNFREVIERLYRRTILHIGGRELEFPNWLFQALGLVAQDLVIRKDRIGLPSSEKMLMVRKVEDGCTQVGSCLYRHKPGVLKLGSLLTAPSMWLGNRELVEFIQLDLAPFERPGRSRENLEWGGYISPETLSDEQEKAAGLLADHPHPDLEDLHLAAMAVASMQESAALAALDFLEKVVSRKGGAVVEPALLLLRRTTACPLPQVRSRAFQILVPAEKESVFPTTLENFLAFSPEVLDGPARDHLCESTLSTDKLRTFFRAAAEVCERPTEPGGDRLRAGGSILRFLADYGTCHPTRYREVRMFLAREIAFGTDPRIREHAREAIRTLQDGFRQWLGVPSRIAVDPETGEEYRWSDVVVFDESAPEEDRRRLLDAVTSTPFLREAVFLFSRGVTIRLNDIPPGGVFIRLLGSNHGKSVYRVTVQTRLKGSFDIAANVNHDLPSEEVQDEIFWLLLCGESPEQPPLAEEFGGFWENQDLWSEEFIAGETLDRALRRLSRKGSGDDRFEKIWPFLARTTLNAYVDFWNRTGRRWEIFEPEPSNIVAPTHDYHTGARLVSVTMRGRHKNLREMLEKFYSHFILKVEKEYPKLQGLVGRETVYASFLDVLGEQEGIDVLRTIPAELEPDLPRFLEQVESGGFRPMKLHFAVERYCRWAELGTDPTSQARARTVRELFETYHLASLVPTYPETRVRFFRDTVFRNAPEPLARGLEKVVDDLRQRELTPEEVADAIADLRSRLDLSADDDYFLTRLSFPHLRPEDSAAFVEADFGGRQQSEVVVFQEDRDGNPFRIRHAMNPREVGRLHRLFLAANMDVRFRMEHQYLVALNQRNQVIGGIFYEIGDQEEAAHLEKIVVAEPYRRIGVADALMHEFFNRLRAAGVKTVTTGFFRPEYFYAYGFTIEKQYAGLMKSLVTPPEEGN